MLKMRITEMVKSIKDYRYTLKLIESWRRQVFGYEVRSGYT